VSTTTAPPSGIVGWGAARKILEHVKDDERRALLAKLCARAGVRGAPGLDYLARRLRWHADDGPWPVPPGRLDRFDIDFIEARARRLLARYADDARLAPVRGLDGA
jgi:hypothetical protein